MPSTVTNGTGFNDSNPTKCITCPASPGSCKRSGSARSRRRGHGYDTDSSPSENWTRWKTTDRPEQGLAVLTETLISCGKLHVEQAYNAYEPRYLARGRASAFECK